MNIVFTFFLNSAIIMQSHGHIFFILLANSIIWGTPYLNKSLNLSYERCSVQEKEVICTARLIAFWAFRYKLEGKLEYGNTAAK